MGNCSSCIPASRSKPASSTNEPYAAERNDEADSRRCDSAVAFNEVEGGWFNNKLSETFDYCFSNLACSTSSEASPKQEASYVCDMRLGKEYLEDGNIGGAREQFINALKEMVLVDENFSDRIDNCIKIGQLFLRNKEVTYAVDFFERAFDYMKWDIDNSRRMELIKQLNNEFCDDDLKVNEALFNKDELRRVTQLFALLEEKVNS